VKLFRSYSNNYFFQNRDLFPQQDGRKMTPRKKQLATKIRKTPPQKKAGSKKGKGK
jgi:hypothetical protein